MMRTREPVTCPVTRPLTFKGLDLCDGCGATLDPRDRLSGLCAACLAPNGDCDDDRTP